MHEIDRLIDLKKEIREKPWVDGVELLSVCLSVCLSFVKID